MKELAENDMITKEEFLKARQSNIGGLLPLTNAPAGFTVDKPVPSPDMIIERINALKPQPKTVPLRRANSRPNAI